MSATSAGKNARAKNVATQMKGDNTPPLSLSPSHSLAPSLSLFSLSAQRMLSRPSLSCLASIFYEIYAHFTRKFN